MVLAVLCMVGVGLLIAMQFSLSGRDSHAASESHGSPTVFAEKADPISRQAGTIHADAVYVPKDLEDCFSHLQELLSAEDIKRLA